MPENWQNGAETEGRMRRAQLIGLVGIVVVSGLWATPAVGQEVDPELTGNTLLRHCDILLRGVDSNNYNREEAVEGGRCIGVVGSISVLSTLPDTPLYRRVCYPPSVETGQLVRVVVNWLEDHPEQLHLHFVRLTVDALVDAFPCSP
jgi:hypothetical protein